MYYVKGDSSKSVSDVQDPTLPLCLYRNTTVIQKLASFVILGISSSSTVHLI